MIIHYMLDCEHVQALSAATDETLTDPKQLSAYAWCSRCQTWAIVIEAVDPIEELAEAATDSIGIAP